jgi:hypothetical protein
VLYITRSRPTGWSIDVDPNRVKSLKLNLKVDHQTKGFLSISDGHVNVMGIRIIPTKLCPIGQLIRHYGNHEYPELTDEIDFPP